MLPTASDIRAAADRLRGHIRRTPLTRSSWLSKLADADVWLKLENLQLEGSFKIRGALNALMQSPVAGAVTASAGNHGRALAAAAKTLDVPVTVFAPRAAPLAKLNPIREHGATLVLCDTYDEAERTAIAHARETSVPYISPYNHTGVIAGAGTTALEILEEIPDADIIVVPVGGGGLVSGVALATEGRASLIGAEAAASPVFTTALGAGRLVEVEVRPTLADGLAGNAEPGSITFDLVRDLRIPVIAANEEHIASAMRGLLVHEKQTVEGAGATGVAALLAGMEGLEGKRLVVIISGGNVDPGRLV